MTTPSTPRHPLIKNHTGGIEPKTILPFVALVCAPLIWGGSFSAMRLALRSLNPWSVMWLRMAIALALILPFSRRLSLACYQKGDWRMLLPMVFFQPCLYFVLEAHALQLTTSSQAGVIAAFVPLMVALGAFLVLGEPLGKRTLIGLFLSVTGVVVLSIEGDATGQAANPLVGNILEFLAMACSALNFLIVKRLCDRYNPWLLTAFQVLAGTLFFSPGLFFLVRDTVAWTPRLMLSFLFLGGMVSLGAFGLYNWAMSFVPASKAAIFINMVPVAAVIFGWTLLGESLGVIQCVSAVGVILGVAVSQSAD